MVALVPQPLAYVAVVKISDAMAIKIGDARHGHLTRAEVREAVEVTRVDNSWWDDDPDRGLRLMVMGRTAEGHSVWVVLYPEDEEDGTWNLGTAMRR